MSLDMLSVCDVAGWSPAYIFFATPSDSRLWRGLPLWPTTPTYHPTFSQVAFSYCHQSTLNLGMLAEKAKLPVNVSGGRISSVKIKKGRGKSRSLHSREWLVCVRWRWRSVLSTLALWLCLTWREVGVNDPPACSSQIYIRMRMCLGDHYTVSKLFNLEFAYSWLKHIDDFHFEICSDSVDHLQHVLTSGLSCLSFYSTSTRLQKKWSLSVPPW